MYALKYKNSEDKVAPLLSLYSCQILNYALRNVSIMQINVSLHFKMRTLYSCYANKRKNLPKTTEIVS